MPLDFDPTRPIYLQIIEAVKKRTVSRDLSGRRPFAVGAGNGQGDGR